MGERQKPEHCKHYPFCKHLRFLFSSPPVDHLQTDEVVLPRDAEPTCNQCQDFEPKISLNA